MSFLLVFRCFTGLCIHVKITMSKHSKTSASHSLSSPPPIVASASLVTTVSVPISDALSYQGSSFVALSGGSRPMGPLSTTSAPVSEGQWKEFQLFQRLMSIVKGTEAPPSSTPNPSLTSAPFQASPSLIYTTALPDRPLASVGIPSGLAPLSSVSGSDARGCRGSQGQPLPRPYQPSGPSRLRRASEILGYEGDRSWEAPTSWGDIGGGASAAIGDRTFLDPNTGEYYGYSSDPYGPHTQELQSPPIPQSFGSEFDLYNPLPAESEADILDVENYRGVDPSAVDREARTLLFRYMGDLYRDAPDNQSVGEPAGAGSELGERNTAQHCGLFSYASRPKRPGINLPSEFSNEFLRLDAVSDLKAVPRGTGGNFSFNDPGQSRFFDQKQLAPDTVALAGSLRDPNNRSALKSPFESREYKKDIFPWSFISDASSLSARLAIYAAALSDLLIRAEELEVSKEDMVTIRALILEVSAMQFSQAARMRLLAIDQTRNITLDTIGLRDRIKVSAAVRIPRDGKFLFGGRLLDSIDSDIDMHKRAQDLTSRLDKVRPRRGESFRSRPYSRPFAVFPHPVRSSFRARGRGSGRSARGRGRPFARRFPGGPPPSAQGRK